MRKIKILMASLVVFLMGTTTGAQSRMDSLSSLFSAAMDNRTDSIIRQNNNSICSSVQTMITVRQCDHHGNVNTTPTKVNVSFDKNNCLIIAEHVFEEKDRFAYYYFNDNILVAILYNTDEDIVLKPYKEQISFRCLFNFDGGFVKALLEKLPELTGCNINFTKSNEKPPGFLPADAHGF